MEILKDYYLFEGDSVQVSLVFENITRAVNDVKRDVWEAPAKGMFIVIL